MEDLVTLKKFNTYIEAAGVVELLDKNNITYVIEKTEASGDIVFAGNTLEEELHVKIKAEDFETAQKLLEDLEEIDAEKLEKDYYLFEFSDKELVEILEKPDEWSLNDYRWAQEILKQRGKEVTKPQLEDWKKKRFEFLSQPEVVKGSYVFNAYLFCVLGGIIGFFMGRHTHVFRKLLPNGQKVYAFDEASRDKGRKIEMTGLIFFAIYIILLIVFVIS